MGQNGIVPPLAPGRYIELAGRGRTFFRALPGDIPVLLIHGWTATGGLNYGFAMPVLAGEFAPIAMDVRGHGRGIRSSETFSLEDCADDAAALLDRLGIEKAIVVGYSMGGAIAPLIWERHPSKVAGLVFCATAPSFAAPRALQRGLSRLSRGLSRLPISLRRSVVPCANLGVFKRLMPIDEMGRDDPLALAQAGEALARYDGTSSLSRINVPTAVVCTDADTLVPLAAQLELMKIPDAHIFSVRSPAGHFVAGQPGEFPTQLMAACRDVARRSTLTVES